MASCLRLAFVLLALAWDAQVSAQWDSPYFEKPPDGGEGNVVFTQDDASPQIVKVEFDEGVPDTSKVVLTVMTYAGPTTPIIKFSEGTVENLGLSIRKEPSLGGKWVLEVSKTQDYESSFRSYRVEISVQGVGTPGFVEIKVRNMNDNVPYFDTASIGCEDVNENFKGLTSCMFTLSDRDGITAADAAISVEPSALFKLTAPEQAGNSVTVKLEVTGDLNFETAQLHTLTLTASDGKNPAVPQSVILRIKDLPDTGPVWVNPPPPVLVINENTEAERAFSARDGDSGDSASPLTFELTEGDPSIFSVENTNENNGLLKIKKIDREAGQAEFMIKIVAKEKNNETQRIEQQIQVIINDVNDETPVITPTTLEKSIEEGHIGLIDFGKIEIVDPDLGTGGQFTVELLDESDFEWKSAFNVVPNSGYQNAVVTISVIDSAKINFENENWRAISLTLKVTEVADPLHTASIPITITVTDKNDEMPVFSPPAYDANVPEIVAIDTDILTVVANDGDAGDILTYSILSVTTAVKIDNTTGKITTARENPFDFETQQQIIFQVAATDSEGKRAIAQVTLTVEDINDTPPTISLPSTQLQVDENCEPGTIVTNEITAQDPDTLADLEFSVDWEATYATNKGVRVENAAVYKDCLKFSTESITIGNKATVKAVLETVDNKFDWELFDALYVNMVVTDKNQLANNERRATLTIGVKNVNDNAPVFVPDTLEDKSIRENSPADQLIGYVVATDPDNLDPIIYTIASNGDSPIEWVTINAKGEIRTTVDAIDAERFALLEYKVTASDGSKDTAGDIKINVIDVNDESPIFAAPGGPFPISENAENGVKITTVTATDLDNSEPFGRKLEYELNIDYPELTNYFAVEKTTGEVTVQKRPGYELDRDQAPFGIYTIELVVRDNRPITPGFTSESLSGRTSFNVTLTDVNDESPVFENVLGDIKVNENVGVDGLVYAGVSAPDKDVAGTPFATVTYSITKILPESGEGIFKLENKDNKADILAAKELTNLFNIYTLTIKATDGGDRSNEKDFIITVLDLNDNPPSFLYPATDNFQMRVSVNQTAGSNLNNEDDLKLPELHGADEDDSNSGNGQIEFSIIGDSNATKYLSIVPSTVNKARLVVKEPFPESGLRNFKLTILAKDKGTDPKQTEISGDVFIINLSEEPPKFNAESDQEFTWEENDASVSDVLTKLAEDANNVNNPQEAWQLIYYHIIDGDKDGQFTITHTLENNVNTPTIQLRDPSGPGLDSDAGDNLYELKVVAANTQTPPTGELNDESAITVKINVKDLPDSKPTFPENLYVGGIAPTDIIGVEVIRIEADDSDENDPRTYSIVAGSMSASEDYLEEVMSKAFQIDDSTGSLKTNFAPKDYMKGYFSFKVQAVDTVGSTAETDVKIYIINESNRVKFLFVNDFNKVDDERDFIGSVFTQALSYKCAIDYIALSEEQNGNVTEVTTHFIDSNSNTPVEGSVIEGKASNIETLSSMRSELLKKDLNLYDLLSNRKPEEDNLASILTITLIVVSVVLGALVAILLVAFVFKTRGLNRRLQALSTTRFGSQESGLNRVAMNVPNTNKHAIEGSNPVWNEDVPNYDNNSQGSGDSDLIGVEDRPEFGYKENEGYQQGSYGDYYSGADNTNSVIDHPDDPATYL